MYKTLPRYQVVTTIDAESYGRALPGVELDVVQTGPGFGPNTVRAAVFDDATLCVGSVGFPVRGGTTLSDEYLIAVVVSSAPLGTRWCGYDLAPGDALLYSPGTHHTGISPTGVRYTAAIIAKQSVEETADALQMRIHLPRHGSVRRMQPASSDRSIVSVLADTLFQSTDNEDPALVRRNVLQSLASELSEDGESALSERVSVQESRRIVRRCLEFVHEQGGDPSIASLCDVAHVSERRLRNAFIRAYGQPPTKFFRDLRLNSARDRLLAASYKSQTVTDIALSFGFEHGGRFSHRYFELFGELPSATLSTGR